MPTTTNERKPSTTVDEVKPTTTVDGSEADYDGRWERSRLRLRRRWAWGEADYDKRGKADYDGRWSMGVKPTTMVEESEADHSKLGEPDYNKRGEADYDS
ncbi:hypothetical protein BJ508DRAFT_330727 [Ascobolus immersus RN42]|uniref:Uncharacterized protein n=1 Tax=Ascobolus immersus RN42 TaxID=1160509 RepID=A0A3N4HYB2_ASCIM|nr:hypothetical protein BJ508DRAFT_330727 [Ascobolus immersus RN42]